VNRCAFEAKAVETAGVVEATTGGVAARATALRIVCPSAASILAQKGDGR
jgi:hypothetical protein